MDTHIRIIIKDFLREKEKEFKEKEKLEKILATNLGRELRKYVHLGKIYRNKLVFYTNTSSSGFDFNLKKNDLLEAVRKEFPQIEDIKIKVGG